jgi:hypothetical protein
LCLSSHSIILVIPNRYHPYAHLSGPFVGKKRHLYSDLSEGDKVKLLKRLATGSALATGPSKGCGFDLDALSGSEKKEFNMVLGVFPLHNPAALKALEDAWMPMSWPSKLPLDSIADYFGEEVASTRSTY